jgi:hypothetical protein
MVKWKKYWDFALERAVKTVAQVALAAMVAGAGILDVDWLQIASVSLLAGIMSLLTSVLTYDKADLS